MRDEEFISQKLAYTREKFQTGKKK
jgi:hypothetical protein